VVFGGIVAPAGAQVQGAPTRVEVKFEAVQAAAIRVVIQSTADGAQPGIDEIEVFGPETDRNLAHSDTGAVASASSCISGYAAHAITHLNDGQYGNARSWISDEAGAGWAQIDFVEAASIDRVVLSRDRLGQYTDRKISAFEMHYLDAQGSWTKLLEEQVAVIDLNAIPSPPRPPALSSRPEVNPSEDAQLVEAFLQAEYALLTAQGRVDFHPIMSQPRYNMERPGPRHVGDDHLPLPTLAVVPSLDGQLGDAAWDGASRGVARVADVEGFAPSPLVEYAVHAGTYEDSLFLAVQTPRLLSAFVALVSAGDWAGCGAVVFDGNSLAFQPFFDGKKELIPIEGAFDEGGTIFECRLPVDWFRGFEMAGLRIGLGLGGKYTTKFGRPVTFMPAPMAIAQQGYRDGHFQIRMTDAAGNANVIGEAATRGPLGPEEVFEIEGYKLHLLHYAPATGCIDQAVALCDRLEAKGVEVSAAHDKLLALQVRNDAWLVDDAAKPPAQRALYYEARLLKRELFLSDPDLAPVERILFVKREPFRPSHNYSVILDAPWNPGGAVCIVDIPRNDGRLDPGAAQVKTVFDAGDGLARTPMADFECENVYFAYKPTEDGYFHLYRASMADGAIEQLSEGPFHDYWPCPLPDGGLAFISTRCNKRFLCWRPQAATLHRMDADGGNIFALSHANLTEWAPSVMDDGRIIWTRSEYQDKAADFGHTLWAIRPDGTYPELVFGNTITKTNGYANGRFVPGRNEVACTLISHFGDLNGPIALLDLDQGRFNPEAISSITPEVFWPGSSPDRECFRDPVPISEDLILCSHAPEKRFDLYVLDRYGNRELLYSDPEISSMTPTPFLARPRPPVIEALPPSDSETGEFVITDVYQGLEPQVARGEAAYLAVSVEVEHTLDQLGDGSYRADHEPFQQFYASPSDVLTGPNGWPTYAAKERLGVVPIEPDGSVHFNAPAGRVLYFHVLDEAYNELQRMRSVVQLQPGERRSCIGCHEDRGAVSARPQMPQAMSQPARDIQPDPWGPGAFSYERVVQPVLDAHCVRCHDGTREDGLDLRGDLDDNKIPASYRTLISMGLVHYADWTWSNPDVCAKLPPRELGTVKSRLFEVIEGGHHELSLPEAELRALKTWVDLNCPLWPDYTERKDRRAPAPLQAWIQAIAGRAHVPTE
jgi:hypothetical protein